MKLKALVLSLSLIALGTASVYAADASKNTTDSQAKSPSVTSATSTGSSHMDFDKADKNHDGQLSRAEFDAMMKGSSSASGGSTNGKDLSKPSSTSSTTSKSK